MSLSILFMKVVIWCLGAYRDLEQNYPIWVPCPKPIISLLILLIKMMISCLGASRALQLDFPIWAPCPKPFISLSVFLIGGYSIPPIYIYIYIYVYVYIWGDTGKTFAGERKWGFPPASLPKCKYFGVFRVGRGEDRGSRVDPPSHRDPSPTQGKIDTS
jgi:hypothetical protein